MVNSKKKGNRGELRICKILSERFNVKFNRVPNSGAFGTTHALQIDAQRVLSGDLICPKLWVFDVEIKFGYDLDLINFFADKEHSDKKTFKGFCEQACEDASRIKGRIPMVLYTKDRKETIVAIPRKNNSRSSFLSKMVKQGERDFFLVNFELEKFPKWKEWIVMSLPEIIKEEDSFFFDEEKIK